MPADKPALLIIDRAKDYRKLGTGLPIHEHARAISAPINRLGEVFRSQGWPVVFATAADHREDFISPAA